MKSEMCWAARRFKNSHKISESNLQISGQWHLKSFFSCKHRVKDLFLFKTEMILPVSMGNFFPPFWGYFFKYSTAENFLFNHFRYFREIFEYKGQMFLNSSLISVLRKKICACFRSSAIKLKILNCKFYKTKGGDTVSKCVQSIKSVSIFDITLIQCPPL